MPLPSPEPTPAQYVTVAEIAMVSVEDAITMISANSSQDIVDAQWAATLSDITTWADIEDEAGDIKRVGSIEFFENTIERSRLAFRNKLRARYGLSLLASDTSVGLCEISSLEWF